MLHSSNLLVNNNMRMTFRKSVKLDNSNNDFDYIGVNNNIYF